MEKTFLKYVLKYSLRQQITLTLLIVGFYPIYLVSLELPKLIVNEAIQASKAFGPYLINLRGIEFEIDADQVGLLFTLSLAYLSVVLITGAIKFQINLMQGRLGETLLMRLRYMLFRRLLLFPVDHFRSLSHNKIIPMVTSEVEPIGSFSGAVMSTPLFMGGQLIIALYFIIGEDITLGLAALAFYPVQIWLIPKLQKIVNNKAKERTVEVRKLADHIGESVSQISEIHTHSTSRYELAATSSLLGRIYGIRYDIFKLKFLIKFLNNFIDKLTPFFFFAIGGYLVIKGQLEVGSLVAVLSAYKDMGAPWKELLKWYQTIEDVKIKYQQVVVQFDPNDMMKESLQTVRDSDYDQEIAMLDDSQAKDLPPPPDIKFQGVVKLDDQSVRVLDSLSLSIPSNKSIAIVGDGKSELARCLARLIPIDGGRIDIGEHSLGDMHELDLSNYITYVPPSLSLAARSIGENLAYSLRQSPKSEKFYGHDELKQRRWLIANAIATDNSTDDIAADWTDFERTQTTDIYGLHYRMIEVLEVVELDHDIYQMGLKRKLNPIQRPDLSEKIMIARVALQGMFSQGRGREEGIIEAYDALRFNHNASILENILFGIPAEGFSFDELILDPYVVKVIDDNNLTWPLIKIGANMSIKIANILLNTPEDDEALNRFNDLPRDVILNIASIAKHYTHDHTDDDSNQESVDQTDENIHAFLSLAFQLIPAKHNVDIDITSITNLVLSARKEILRSLPDHLEQTIVFFADDMYHPYANILENIIYGKIATNIPNAEAKALKLVDEVLTGLKISQQIMILGLENHVGNNGDLLSAEQKQKIAIARALLKNPETIILNESLSVLGLNKQRKVIQNILRYRQGKGTIWMGSPGSLAAEFDQTIVLANGRLQGQNSYGQLLKDKPNLAEILS